MAGKVSSHIRSNVVGYIALFFALGLGSAWAATELEKNEVKSKHIKNGGVKSNDLADNAVTSPKVANGSLLGEDFAPGQLPAGEPGPPGERGAPGEDGEDGDDASVLQTAAVTQEESFSAPNSADVVDLGGPEVTVTVPSGGMVRIYAMADMKRSVEDGAGCAVRLEDSAGDFTRVGKLTTGLPGYLTIHMNSGGAGTDHAAFSNAITVPATPGTHTYKLTYAAHPGFGATPETCWVKNRRLWVEVFH
jgi:hypothetical protein